MTRRNLVVVRAGDTSLHPQWLLTGERNWDLAVSYYGKHPERYIGQYDILHQCRGTKFPGLNDFILNNSDVINSYEFIWFPDDDLLTTGRNINEFFDICRRLRLAVAQPALTPNSHYTWDITLERPALAARLTNFVEIMAPCFAVAELPLFGQIFSENTSGYGYEFLWYRLGQQYGYDERFGIVDRTPVYHTRAVGGAAGATVDPLEEQRQLFLKYGLEIFEPAVLREIPWAGLH